MKLKALALSVLLVLIAIPAQGSTQVLPLWNYNVTLDVGNKDVTVKPLSVSSSLDTITRSIMVQGENETDYTIVYIHEHTKPQMLDLEDRLWKFMKTYCTMTETDPGEIAGMTGFVATGYARVKHGFGKQVCYGGIAALPSGAVAQRDFAILAHFTNKTLNEQLVKTAKVEYVGKMVAI
ncbi:MAG TPA: hypothetical protein VLB04_02240 [Methanotrichaceae archaeon]|nr:hypothetical protein [Methanotrichaceae archaeon]